jgi:hypothetical protein
MGTLLLNEWVPQVLWALAIECRVNHDQVRWEPCFSKSRGPSGTVGLGHWVSCEPGPMGTLLLNDCGPWPLTLKSVRQRKILEIQSMHVKNLAFKNMHRGRRQGVGIRERHPWWFWTRQLYVKTCVIYFFVYRFVRYVYFCNCRWYFPRLIPVYFIRQHYRLLCPQTPP